MNSIKEDGDEEMALEKKKRRGISTHNGYDRNKIFNTVSITA